MLTSYVHIHTLLIPLLHKPKMKDASLINARLASVIRLLFLFFHLYLEQHINAVTDMRLVFFSSGDKTTNWFEILIWASVEITDT